MSETHNATGGNADAPSTAATMAVMGQQLTDENAHLRALLAQRDAELEALREKVRAVYELVTLFNHTAVYDLKSDILAALSDNQEGRDE